MSVFRGFTVQSLSKIGQHWPNLKGKVDSQWMCYMWLLLLYDSVYIILFILCFVTHFFNSSLRLWVFYIFFNIDLFDRVHFELHKSHTLAYKTMEDCCLKNRCHIFHSFVLSSLVSTSVSDSALMQLSPIIHWLHEIYSFRQYLDEERINVYTPFANFFD